MANGRKQHDASFTLNLEVTHMTADQDLTMTQVVNEDSRFNSGSEKENNSYYC